MLQNLTGWHALIILAIVVLVFGAAKLPALARSVGQSMRILRAEATERADTSSTSPAIPAEAAPGAASVHSGATAEPAVRTAE
jgi:sec-independent protein translocase protein TatA